MAPLNGPEGLMVAQPVVQGIADGNNIGVLGTSPGGVGVEGASTGYNAVQGTSAAIGASGVYGQNNGGGYGVAGSSEDGVGVFGRGKTAGRFDGDVQINGHIHCPKDSAGNAGTLFCFDVSLNGEDCAEYFDVSGVEVIGPGTIMVLDDNGSLIACDRAYDRRVAGAISGAGEYKPGIVLGNNQHSERNRLPIALLGKVYCKVDADLGPISIGDLLTTSTTTGYAMKAADTQRAFGAVIGKAMRPLTAGRGLIPVLIALQ